MCTTCVSFGVSAAFFLCVLRPEPSPAKAFPSPAGRETVPPEFPHPALRRPKSPPPSGLFLHFLGGALIRGDFLFVFSSFLCCSKTGLAEAPHLEGSSTSREKRLPRSAAAPPAHQRAGAPTCLPLPPPAFVLPRKPAAGSLMHPFQWCNGESPGREGTGLAGDVEGGTRLKIRQRLVLSLSS